MSWAKNYGDRFNTSGNPDKRAKAIEKACARCGTGIENRKTYCGPCRAVRYDETVAANRAKYKAVRTGTDVGGVGERSNG